MVLSWKHLAWLGESSRSWGWGFFSLPQHQSGQFERAGSLHGSLLGAAVKVKSTCAVAQWDVPYLLSRHPLGPITPCALPFKPTMTTAMIPLFPLSPLGLFPAPSLLPADGELDGLPGAE